MTTQSIPSEVVASVKDLYPVNELLTELRDGLSQYWKVAQTVLRDNGVELFPPNESYFSYSKNFFSLLFLYSFFRANIPKQRRILYASTLQCLRGMVTGCDNLLDDEYKMTLDTDIAETGYRFRSVIDIMISDRVLFQILLQASENGCFPVGKVIRATTASMHSMMRSGVQEASEEAGISEILSPDALLKQVHHFKTGLLFTCPWDIPLSIEAPNHHDNITQLKEGLYAIGMGCQVMDDMVDFSSDLEKKRHNYLVSLIYHQSAHREKTKLREIMDPACKFSPSTDITAEFPEATATAATTSHTLLDRGLRLLFAEEHTFLIEPAKIFLQKRIGVNFSHNSL
ncbi:MAG: class 1 isoprenoid biosynthesis enzyme [Desulfopila sp.]|jgi:hypothetical protein|nr:class 1 isoprenoid biosynthesis enzyme [Desulfopila sp.]